MIFESIPFAILLTVILLSFSIFLTYKIVVSASIQDLVTKIISLNLLSFNLSNKDFKFISYTLDGNKTSQSYEKLFQDYRLKMLKDTKDRVKYTLYITLTKIDNKWVVDELSEPNQEKILGIYVY